MPGWSDQSSSGATPPTVPGPPAAPPPPTQPDPWAIPAPGPEWGIPPTQGAPQQGQWGTPPPPGAYQQPAQPYQYGGWQGWDGHLGLRIASAGLRIGAKAIDVLIIIVIQVVLGFLATALFFTTGSANSFGSESGIFFGPSLAIGFAIAAVGLLIDFVFNVLLVARFGGQPGKLMLGLRIVNGENRPADMKTAFIRWCPSLVLLVISAVPLVGLLGSLGRLLLAVINLVLIFVDDQRRDVYDRVAGTFVVATR